MTISPVFILGCGRSGTTILGNALSRHSKITYLNERRDLWFLAYPETDIWTNKAVERNGKLFLTAADAEAGKSVMLRQLFIEKAAKTNRPLLVEKLPINNFRVDFLNEIFPEARFIHIYRNGFEVAKSIEKLSKQGQWYGSNNYKWNQLVQLAQIDKITKNLPGLCVSHYYMGLLEWRMSTECAINFLQRLPAERFVEISYAQLMTNPEATIKEILSFLDIESDMEVLHFARNKIVRRSIKMEISTFSEAEKKIGGYLLPLSISGARLTCRN
jgi:hypothetical protein